MSFTYAKVTTLSPLYLDDLYGRNPGLEEAGYQEQYDALMADGHVWADHITRHLRGLGVDAHEIAYNAEPLQRAWAREHGTQATGLDLLAEQLRALGPDVVFLHASYPLYAEMVPLVKERVPGVRLIQGWVCVGFEERHHPLFRSVDFVVTCEDGLLRQLRDAGARAHRIAHGFEHSMAERVPAVDEPTADVFFAGSLVVSDGYHRRRVRLLQALAAQGVDVRMHSRPVEARGTLPEGLRERIAPPVFGLDMYRALAGARIAFNNHIDAVESAANLRLFEATGMGTCLITDHKPGLAELFDIDREVVAYASAEECAEKVRWLLEHPAERQAIARAGQRRTLADHRLQDRVGMLHDILRRELARKAGRAA